MPRRALVLLVAGCAARAPTDAGACAHATVAIRPAPIVDAPRLRAGIPHGGEIRAVAATERGDAAISVDVLGGVRLWPSLDGRRLPLVIPASAPAELALARAGDELLAAILDEAGGVTLSRVGPDGELRGRVQLPGGDAYVHVVAIDGGMLAVRRDETIERYDARGVRRGRIAADPGERLGAVAVRRGRAIALVETAPGEARAARWIALDGGLAWGPRVELPEAVSPDALALAPTLARIAVVPAPRELDVLDLSPVAHQVWGPAQFSASSPGTLGFADDATVAIAGRAVASWHLPDLQRARPDADGSLATGAIVDGRVISAGGGSLELFDPATSHTRYLGWAQLAGAGSLEAVGDRVVLENSDRSGEAATLSWLDAHLARTRTYVGPQHGQVAPVDDRHVLVHGVAYREAVLQREDDKPRPGPAPLSQFVKLVDLDAPDAPVSLDVPALNLAYRADLGVIAVGDAGVVRRWRLDVARGRATELPPVHIGPSVDIALLDPARAGGAVAFAVEAPLAGEGEKRTTYFGASAAVDGPRIDGAVIANDASGTLAVRERTDVRELARDGAAARFDVETDQATIAVFAHADRELAIADGCIVSLYDPRGARRWRHALCGVHAMTFTPDDHELVASTAGGVIALDPATGDPVAAACGWDFGLHDDLPSQALDGEPVCGR